MRRVFDLKTFEKSNNPKYPVTAAGILFYKLKAGRLYLLLISYEDPARRLLDDFGGKTDCVDDTIFDTICREAAEETNSIVKVDRKSILSMPAFYNAKAKYYLVLQRLNSGAYQSPSIFGDVEDTNNIKRTINWYEYSERLKPRLCYRLKGCTVLLKFLDNLRLKNEY